jgi:hypothetical protein
LTNWIKKEDSTICCLQENHLSIEISIGLGWKARRFTKPMVPTNRQE